MHEVWAHDGNRRESCWEYNALIIGVCVLLILAGAGTYSLDHVIGWNNIVAGIFHVPA